MYFHAFPIYFASVLRAREARARQQATESANLKGQPKPCQQEMKGVVWKSTFWEVYDSVHGDPP